MPIKTTCFGIMMAGDAFDRRFILYNKLIFNMIDEKVILSLKMDINYSSSICVVDKLLQTY